MTSFRVACEVCGLSQREAANYFDVSPSTIDKWWRGARPVPSGAWEMLADLWGRIEDASENAALTMERDGIDPRAMVNIAADDGTDPLPEGSAAAAGAIALLVALAADAKDA